MAYAPNRLLLVLENLPYLAVLGFWCWVDLFVQLLHHLCRTVQTRTIDILRRLACDQFFNRLKTSSAFCWSGLDFPLGSRRKKKWGKGLEDDDVESGEKCDEKNRERFILFFYTLSLWRVTEWELSSEKKISPKLKRFFFLTGRICEDQNGLEKTVKIRITEGLVFFIR